MYAFPVQVEHFADNLARVLALHKLTAKDAAPLLGISQSALTKWKEGSRSPSFKTLVKIGDFLGLSADRLARADFADLLAHELADPERFERVEREIAERSKVYSEFEIKAMEEKGLIVKLDNKRKTVE